jgi:large subunit ribosomal protein L28
MARSCDVCGKHTQVGSQVQRRGIAKKQGGIGIRITSREKRKFKPNIQNVKVMVGKTATRMRVCTRCIKAGKVAKRA